MEREKETFPKASIPQAQSTKALAIPKMSMLATLASIRPKPILMLEAASLIEFLRSSTPAIKNSLLCQQQYTNAQNRDKSVENDVRSEIRKTKDDKDNKRNQENKSIEHGRKRKKPSLIHSLKNIAKI